DLPAGYIRLLILHPVLAHSTEIKCTLKEFAMDKAPEWEALSYAWGEPECDKRITVNRRGIFVRQNLLHALLHLRSESDRILWVDALSINQGNIAERNHQAIQISRIYRNS
ncbi:heterokaryon incompatibility protein-domain-containing protein, partial [Leptodontidium sp. MPI-SDFR-AT-0119]